MELIKISKNELKLILSEKETKKYNLKKNSRDNSKAVLIILSRLEKDCGISLCCNSVRVKMNFLYDGECEILLKELPSESRFTVRTFIFDDKSLEKAINVFKNTDVFKSSALYYLPKPGLYIWELISRVCSPLPCRLRDFGREIELSSRREFLNALCERRDFKKTDT